MYNYIQPKLKSGGVSEVLLEVIDENIQAIKSYKKVGFIKEGNLTCFKGKVVDSGYNTSATIAELENTDFSLLQSFLEWKPTWQQSTATLKKLPDYKIYGAFLGNELVGYIFANRSLGRVAQFAVKSEYRKQGIGRALFHHFATLSTCEICVFNTNGNQPETHTFFTETGINHILSQHKMVLNLN